MAHGDLPGAVLFACNMNAVRSPMAAALMHHLFGQRVYVASAGVRPGEKDHLAIAVMEEMGIDLNDHMPQSFAELSDTSFDLVISLTPEAHHTAMELTRAMAVDAEYWPTLDPTLETGNREQKLEAYRACRDNLFKKIKTRFQVGGAPIV